MKLLTLDVYDFIFSDGDAGGSEGSPSTRDPQLQESYSSESLEQLVSETDIKDLILTSIW